MRGTFWAYALLAAAGCTVETGDGTAGAHDSSDSSSGLSQELADVQIERWDGFKRLAQMRDSGDVLAAELFRTQNGNAAAVMTMAEHGTPIRYIVMMDSTSQSPPAGEPGVTTDVAVPSDGSMDPMSISIGRPPPTQPTPPGVASLGSTMMSAAFGTLDVPWVRSGGSILNVRRGPSSSTSAVSGLDAVHIDVLPDSSRLSREISNVQLARWKGFQQLAANRADGDTLALELFRTVRDETVAVFTVVMNGEPVHYVLQGDSLGQLPPTAAADAVDPAVQPDGSVDPSTVALGSPPIKQPSTPGITKTGQSFMTGAFNCDE